MRNRMFNNMIKKVCLAAVVAFSACTDAWEEHYDSAEKLASENLYDYISKQENLSTFAEMIAIAGYDSILAQSQSYTVWAPVNDALVGFDTSDKGLVTRTVSNQISRGKHTTAMLATDRIDLLSNKNVAMTYVGDEYFFDIAKMTDYNNLASNGLVHMTDKYVPFKPNFYELLSDYTGLDSMKKYIYSNQIKEFNPERSDELGLDDLNRPIYDSAFDYSNVVLDVMGEIDDEKQNFLGVMLDNDAWIEGYDRVSKYLNIPEFQGGAERQDRLTRLMLVKDLMFDLDRYDIEDYMSEDSLISYDFDIFYNPSDWLSELPSVDVSNGIAHIASEFPYEDTAFLVSPIIVEAERIYNRENTNNAISSRSSYASDLDISYNHYISVIPTNASDAKSSVSFKIPNTLSTKYNIYCVFVPHNVIDENNHKSSRVKFRLSYIKSSGRVSFRFFTPEDNETKVDGMTKMFVGQFDFEYANVSFGDEEDRAAGYTDEIVTLQVENLVKVAEETESDLYTRDMLIDCIIFEPVVE